MVSRLQSYKLLALSLAFLSMVGAGAFMATRSAQAAALTWDGGGGDENWNTCANWTTDTCPTAGDTVTFDGTSTKNATINTAIEVAGFTIASGYTGTITQGSGQTVTIGGSHYSQATGTFVGSDAAFSVAGTFTMTGGTFTAPNAAFTVTSNLSVSTGTMSFAASSADLNSNLILNSGTMNLNTATIQVAGNIQRSGGTLNQNTSSVIMDSGSQLMSGDVKFYNFTKTGTGNLILSSNNTMLVTGTLTLQGSSASSQLNVYANSAGTRATLEASGTIATLQYLNVKDINASQTMTCTTGCTDGGNNVNWIFRRSGSTYIPSPTHTVTVLSPNGGESLSVGDEAAITWSWTGSVANVNLSYSVDGGASWEAIVLAESNDGSYAWTVPNDPSDDVLIRVAATDLVVEYTSDDSDASFAIVGEEGDDATNEDGAAQDDLDLPSSMRVHDLVKLADDGNPDTQVDSAVYYIGADGKRHAFPNEKVFFTWFANFDDVKIVSAADLAAVELGRNVTYRPGARMVKFQTSPQVYAVDSYGTLRWVSSEAVAAALYGSDWNTMIDDISDAFFRNYTFGDDVASTRDFDVDEVYDSVAFPSDSLMQ